ncbi:hypothetical protein BJ170DRAFT_719861 [Xylariales sp. AK1849]|nr:hypothetical protein BJ170DRAFT_719861 [Xylariales sp. AK1849]
MSVFKRETPQVQSPGRGIGRRGWIDAVHDTEQRPRLAAHDDRDLDAKHGQPKPQLEGRGGVLLPAMDVERQEGGEGGVLRCTVDNAGSSHQYRNFLWEPFCVSGRLTCLHQYVRTVELALTGRGLCRPPCDGRMNHFEETSGRAPCVTTIAIMHRFFKSTFYNFEFLRILSMIPFGGADMAKRLVAAGQIKDLDPVSWNESWPAQAEKAEGLASQGAYKAMCCAVAMIAQIKAVQKVAAPAQDALTSIHFRAVLQPRTSDYPSTFPIRVIFDYPSNLFVRVDFVVGLSNKQIL